MNKLVGLLHSLVLSVTPSIGSAAEPPKIPLTIGFANLAGDDLSAIASEDAAALSPLFARGFPR